MYGGELPTFQKFKRYLQAISNETSIASSAKPANVVQTTSEVTSESEVKCWIDGSWAQEWQGGVGYAFFKGRELVRYHSSKALVCCPMQAEATALREAIICAQDLGYQQCEFLTDSQGLAKAVDSLQPPKDADWRAFREIHFAWRVLKEQPLYCCRHIPRELNGIADKLAKLGRLNGWCYTGYTFPMFPI